MRAGSRLRSRSSWGGDPEVLRRGGELAVVRLGLVDYLAAWELQRRLVEARRQDLVPDVLLLLEHPPTYTLGRRGKREHILLPSVELEERGVSVYEVDRGGDVTYHGPGQLVGYPIFKLPSRRQGFVGYIRDLEAALLAAVRELGSPAELKEGLSGVWIGGEKVCAIGVKIDAYGITSHGFALNVRPDLSYFGHIIPCGIRDKGVTSLEYALGHGVSIRRVSHAVVDRLAERFELTPSGMGKKKLLSLTAADR